MEADDYIYISKSKENINSYMLKNNYRSAFGLLLSVLERLDDGPQKNDFIRYYLNKFFDVTNPMDLLDDQLV
jgi:hypothetical protein